MTHPCTGCGLRLCEGECYFATPTDDEAIEPGTTVYVPSPEYLAWCAEIDAERTTVTNADPLRHLEPKRRAA